MFKNLIPHIVGASLGTKLFNGKFKYGKSRIGEFFGYLFFLLMLGVFFGLLYYGIMNISIEFIIMPLIGIFGLGYTLCVSARFQNPNNYNIQFVKKESHYDLVMYYKKKQISLLYRIDEKGKFAFLNNNKKLSCINYADNSKMSNYTRYKILNYLTHFLIKNNLLSDETTVTFEEF